MLVFLENFPRGSFPSGCCRGFVVRLSPKQRKKIRSSAKRPQNRSGAVRGGGGGVATRTNSAPPLRDLARLRGFAEPRERRCVGTKVRELKPKAATFRCHGAPRGTARGAGRKRRRTAIRGAAHRHARFPARKRSHEPPPFVASAPEAPSRGLMAAGGGAALRCCPRPRPSRARGGPAAVRPPRRRGRCAR